MAKRRTVSDESDVEETPSTSKRQRRQAADDAYDEEEEAAPSARNTKKNGKGKDKRAKAQDGDEDYDTNAQDAEEEQQFEQQHGEAIRRQVESRSKASGVSHLLEGSTRSRSILNVHTVDCGPWHHRVHRDAPVHVSQVPLLHVWSPHQLHHRYVLTKLVSVLYKTDSRHFRPQWKWKECRVDCSDHCSRR
jgi:hypothetical protein